MSWINKFKNSKDKEYNKLALIIFTEMTTWIVLPIIGALFLGRWLDQRQETGNLYFFGLTALAFVISCVGVSLVGAKYLKIVNPSASSGETPSANISSSAEAPKDKQDDKENKEIKK